MGHSGTQVSEILKTKPLCCRAWFYIDNLIANWFIHGFAVSQINTRHEFLARFVGTQEKEDISYNEANKLNLWVTLTTCLCCILEMGLYSAYNKWVKKMFVYHKSIFLVQVHPWIFIINGGIAETQETDEFKKKKEEEKKKQDNRDKKGQKK